MSIIYLIYLYIAIEKKKPSKSLYMLLRFESGVGFKKVARFWCTLYRQFKHQM